MLALGVDPGTLRLGWGLVERDGSRLAHVAHGVIVLDADAPLAERLAQIAERLTEILSQHRPAVGAVETIFFRKDAQAAAKLGHARGVVLLCLARAGVEVAEYAPARVKRTLVGHGQAEKRQIAQMVRALLRLERLPPPDAADALALAITHLRVGSLLRAVEERRTLPRPRGRALPPALLEAIRRQRKR